MKLLPLHNQLPKRSLLYFAAGLFLLSFLSTWYFTQKPSVEYQQKKLQNYIQDQQQEANELMADTFLMRRLVQKNESLEEFEAISRKKFGFFLFAETVSEQQNLFFWNKQDILPPIPNFNFKDSTYFRRMPNGYYLFMQKPITIQGSTNPLMAYALIPVLNEYFLEDDYVVNNFLHDEKAHEKILFSSRPTAFPVRSIEGETLFYVGRVAYNNANAGDSLTVILRLSALLFILVYIHLIAENVVRTSRALHGIIFFAGAFLLCRMIIYFLPAIFSTRQFELFDPLIYASNYINRSLGDLLINIAMLCWLVLFSWQSLGPTPRIPSFLRDKKLFVGGTLVIFVLIFLTFETANLVQGLVTNSKISFNVTDFFSLNVYTVVGLIVLAILALTYFYFTRILFRYLFPAFRSRQIIIYFLIALIGLFYLTVRSGSDIVLFHLPILFWLIIYTFLISRETFIINRFNATVAGMLFWIFVFSVSLSVIIMQGNRETELRTRKGIAEKYENVSDKSSEPTLSITLAYLDNRFFQANFKRFQDEYENKIIRDSIVNSLFRAYTRHYETRFFVFDSLNQEMNNEDSASYAELNTIFTVQSKKTGIPDVNLHESSYDHFSYITRRIIRDTTDFLGTVFIISTPREYGSSDAFYPKLFRQSNRSDPENSPIYSHAIYDNRLLTTASSKYPFQITLSPAQVPLSEFEQREHNGFDELWYKASTYQIIVIAKKKDSLIESITLFSYLFCAFLIMVGFLQLMAWVVRMAGDSGSINILDGLNIRSQIHGTVIFISVLSFLIIGAATISFFIARYNRNNVDKLSRTAGIMVNEMTRPLTSMDEFNGNSIDSLSGQDLEELVGEVADIHNVDVNIYDLNGNLEITSDKQVYKKGILSNKMHPLAYFHLSRLREVQRVQEETVSSLNYISIYSTIRDNKGVVKKYLNIPYFSSQIDLKQEISNFLVTIINLNAFIFLIAGIIALFITNKITRSFSLIGEKMRDITLGKTNEEIVWNKKDEIGELVIQYNKMVNELEKSAEALAKSEREGAWREMARQVAHEIKNPLTPMKLSIQYLQKAINGNQGNIQELTANVANTLIEQIDHLSKIAADFSQFANIGLKKLELVDLHQVIGSLVDLYSTNPKVNMQWQRLPGSMVLKADKTHMNRLFTNLLANAVDACAGKDSCHIEIHEKQEGNFCTISIKDNGEGIPEEMRHRIFTPNFTTKTSGTGLGLAMCKSIVEQAKGEIWFETEEGKGTIFFVMLPVIS